MVCMDTIDSDEAQRLRDELDALRASHELAITLLRGTRWAEFSATMERLGVPGVADAYTSERAKAAEAWGIFDATTAPFRREITRLRAPAWLTTAPSVAEAIAHAKAHNIWHRIPQDPPVGQWLWRGRGSWKTEVMRLMATERGTVYNLTDDCAWDGGGGEWLPLDVNGFPTMLTIPVMLNEEPVTPAESSDRWRDEDDE